GLNSPLRGSRESSRELDEMLGKLKDIVEGSLGEVHDDGSVSAWRAARKRGGLDSMMGATTALDLAASTPTIKAFFDDAIAAMKEKDAKEVYSAFMDVLQAIVDELRGARHRIKD
ncbi:unnamed protein product, partial [marine sediment metagenome]